MEDGLTWSTTGMPAPGSEPPLLDGEVGVDEPSFRVPRLAGWLATAGELGGLPDPAFVCALLPPAGPCGGGPCGGLGLLEVLLAGWLVRSWGPDKPWAGEAGAWFPCAPLTVPEAGCMVVAGAAGAGGGLEGLPVYGDVPITGEAVVAGLAVWPDGEVVADVCAPEAGVAVAWGVPGEPEAGVPEAGVGLEGVLIVVMGVPALPEAGPALPLLPPEELPGSIKPLSWLPPASPTLPSDPRPASEAPLPSVLLPVPEVSWSMRLGFCGLLASNRYGAGPGAGGK